mmetsp:Transcript_13001/g.23573  ORF Transcript_13001/g.23573 Transcript_13001/m.23573 type:complete len:208 (-) Transcript_13001:378-1001(-)
MYSLFLLTFPSVATVDAKDEYGHGFVGRSGLFLGGGGFDAFAAAAGKERGLEKVSVNATHFVDFIFIGLFPVEPSGILQVLDLFIPFLGLVGWRQVFGRHVNQCGRRRLSQQYRTPQGTIPFQIKGKRSRFIGIPLAIVGKGLGQGRLHLRRPRQTQGRQCIPTISLLQQRWTRQEQDFPKLARNIAPQGRQISPFCLYSGRIIVLR